jgi:hypothetical protein
VTGRLPSSPCVRATAPARDAPPPAVQLAASGPETVHQCVVLVLESDRRLPLLMQSFSTGEWQRIEEALCRQEEGKGNELVCRHAGLCSPPLLEFVELLNRQIRPALLLDAAKHGRDFVLIDGDARATAIMREWPANTCGQMVRRGIIGKRQCRERPHRLSHRRTGGNGGPKKRLEQSTELASMPSSRWIGEMVPSNLKHSCRPLRLHFLVKLGFYPNAAFARLIPQSDLVVGKSE